MHHLSNPMTAP